MSSSRDRRFAIDDWTSLPAPDIYESGTHFWPWKLLLAEVVTIVTRDAPSNATVLDYMCGTGWLLEEIFQRRLDLNVEGCELSDVYVQFARSIRPWIRIHCHNVLEFTPTAKPEVIICTGGIHHLVEHDQDEFIRRMAAQLADGGMLILGEEVIREHSSSRERLRAVSELHQRIRTHFRQVHAPDDVVIAAEQVFYADRHGLGEYKQTAARLKTIVTSYAKIVRELYVWPSDSSGFGDLILICRKHTPSPALRHISGQSRRNTRR